VYLTAESDLFARSRSLSRCPSVCGLFSMNSLVLRGEQKIVCDSKSEREREEFKYETRGERKRNVVDFDSF
jgi:hypothetical protein